MAPRFALLVADDRNDRTADRVEDRRAAVTGADFVELSLLSDAELPSGDVVVPARDLATLLTQLSIQRSRIRYVLLFLVGPEMPDGAKPLIGMPGHRQRQNLGVRQALDRQQGQIQRLVALRDNPRRSFLDAQVGLADGFDHMPAGQQINGGAVATADKAGAESPNAALVVLLGADDRLDAAPQPFVSGVLGHGLLGLDGDFKADVGVAFSLDQKQIALGFKTEGQFDFHLLDGQIPIEFFPDGGDRLDGLE